MDALKQVITVKEAAKLANTTERTIQTRCKAGIYNARFAEKNTWLIEADSVIKKARQDLS